MVRVRLEATSFPEVPPCEDVDQYCCQTFLFSCRLLPDLVGTSVSMACVVASIAGPTSMQPMGFLRGLGSLGMLARAESGQTMSPPAEGFGRLGNRVPSAGTGMGTWSLLVSARKQGPPDFT